MIVFKTVLKILNKLKGMLILYTVVLLSITVLNQTSKNVTSFEETKPSILVINNDTGSTISNGLEEYIKDIQKKLVLIKQIKMQLMMQYFIEI